MDGSISDGAMDVEAAFDGSIADAVSADAHQMNRADGRSVDAGDDAGVPSACNPLPTPESPYEVDSEIFATIEALGPRSGWMMPSSTIHNEGVTTYGSANGPPARDYSNAMVYVPERGTALYAGGSHGTYRGNDVWEYHLASNTWQLRFLPTGGNVGPHKNGIFSLRQWIDDGREPSAEEMANILAFKDWAHEFTHYRDGRYTTVDGGPIMPSHQWDGLTYDPQVRRMVWRSGANAEFSPAAIAYIFDRDVADIEAGYDHTTTAMWTFDPETAEWHWYRHDGETPRSALRGMGASATYVPDLCATIHYAAAQNVTPPVFEMWAHNLATDEWTDLAPNGGTSVRTLSLTENVAPREEAQMAYAPRHRALVAVLEQDAFVYHLDTNTWSHLVTDDRLRAHDARTVFAYDSRNDVFLLQDMGMPDRIFALSLERGDWEEIMVAGDAFMPPPYDRTFGYYDPRHNVLVIGNGRNKRMWLFRYQ